MSGFRVNGTDFNDLFIKKAFFDRYLGLTLWGIGTSGQFGNGKTINSSIPLQTVSGGTNWKQVACGNWHTAAIKTDGTLWCWGENGNGQLGDNTRTDRLSPVQTVAGGTNWSQVACGKYLGHTAAIKTDGRLWLWGRNVAGELGTNDTDDRSSPVQTVSGGTNWKQVSCGGVYVGTFYSFTAAVKTDGRLWLWGRNVRGQLGDNSSTDKSSPVQTVAGGTNWSQVSCGAYHTAAVKTDGTLWLWGENGSGQLGDNTTTDKSSPVQTVAGGVNWKQVYCGADHTAAIKTDGTLWCWGRGNEGQLGDNTTTSKQSPVQTVAGGTNWNQVTSGSLHTLAIKTDGSLWGWGLNTEGQLGTFDSINRSSPIQILPGLSSENYWTFIEAGTRTTAGILK